MSMDSGRIERFQLLLQQIQLTGDATVPYFSNAQIEKLVIEKKARNWHFHSLLEKILPYNIFHQFTNQLETTFSHIAHTSYSIKVLDSEYSEQCVKTLFPID